MVIVHSRARSKYHITGLKKRIQEIGKIADDADKHNSENCRGEPCKSCDAILMDRNNVMGILAAT